MTAPFVVQLRAGRKSIQVGSAGAGSIAFRVEASDIWEAVRIAASPATRVAEVKQRVVAEFFPNDHESEFVLKLRGWEILDENVSLSDAGVANGSILLIAFRRRRAVR